MIHVIHRKWPYLLGHRDTVWDTLNNVTRLYDHYLSHKYNNVTTGLDLSAGDNYLYDYRGTLSRDDGFDDNEDDFFAYTYDHENRLVSVEYDYDGDGNGLSAMASYSYDAQS